MSKYDLGDYEQVADRLERFLAAYPDGRIRVDLPQLLTMPDGEVRIMVAASVYRTPDDPLPCRDFSGEPYPGRTPYTKGSEIENASTSAIGRALRLALGGRHHATANEVAARRADPRDWLTQITEAQHLGQLRALWSDIDRAGQLQDTVEGETLAQLLKHRSTTLELPAVDTADE